MAVLYAVHIWWDLCLWAFYGDLDAVQKQMHLATYTFNQYAINVFVYDDTFHGWS